MDYSKRSQILKLFLIFSLFITTPLIPTTFKSPYLYFILNLLIVALGAEAGFISFFSKSEDQDKKQNISFNAAEKSNSNQENEEMAKPIVPVEKHSSEKIVVEAVMVVSEVKKITSKPSIFFIGNGENEPEDAIEEDEDNMAKQEEDHEGLSKQELFTKTETFIGNFYKQLHLQRQDSWNRIHGFHQKTVRSQEK